MKTLSYIIIPMLFFYGMVCCKEVCKFAYKGYPEDFNDSIMTVPSEMVALSDYLYAGTSGDTICDTCNRTAIFFVIDNSGSMNGRSGMDKNGNRFRVTRDLIDLILKKSPDSEVGVVVFNTNLLFDPAHDTIFKQIPEEGTGRYIPLLRLRKDYDGRKGHEILKHYLQVDSVYNPGRPPFTAPYYTIDLKYKPTWTPANGTNINNGFYSARDGVKPSTIDKKNHYVIFFSDGKATEPRDPPEEKLKYVKGEQIPTTYTIFFDKAGDTLPQQLVDMTRNIQNNGYSTTNPESKIWPFRNSTYDTLMAFLMKNVMSQILKTTGLTPTEMSVNSGQVMKNWDSTAFTFPSLFPLEGVTTGFTFYNKYHVKRDTLDDSGNVHTIEYDTSTNTNFTVRIDPFANPLDTAKFDVRCWDRDIGFFYNGAQQQALGETMNPMEVRFTYDGGTAQYDYTKVSIELITTIGQKQDREVFVLSKSGAFFSKEFSHEMINNKDPEPNNGTLQYRLDDTVVAIFRNNENPKLTLDTLRYKIPTSFTGYVNLDKAFYYDVNADGYVDSIFCHLSTDIIGGLTDEHIDEIVDKSLVLPSFRGFTINDYKRDSNNVYLVVNEELGHTPFTYITDDDIITTKEMFLKAGGKIAAKSITPIDKVAPLIHWDERSALAILQMDSTIADTLQVTFSEPVKYVSASIPFYFLSRDNNTNYTATLQALSQPSKSTMCFVIESYSQSDITIQEGDSIWIHEGDHVGDLCKDASGNTVSNFQNNKSNTKRKVYVDKRLLPFTLIPKAVSPVSLAHIASETYIIPEQYIKLFQEQQLFNDLNLAQQNNGKYTGMIINVVPDNVDNVFEAFQASGTITILDPIGNTIIKDKPMAWDDSKKRLIFVWNLKNSNSRIVGSGMYLCLFDIQETTAEPDNSGYAQKMKLMVGVK